MEIIPMQDIPVDRQTNINFNRNLSESENISQVPQKSMMKRRESVTLKIWIWLILLKLCSSMRYPIFAIFTIIVIIVGVLVMCLTAQEKRDHICPITYKAIITNTKDHDSRPQYVVIGDLNNDSQLDFVIATTGIDSVKTFLGYRNGSFANETKYSTGVNSHPYSVALGDFNNDQCLDIAVANYGTHNIGIFLGYCNGSLKNQTTYSTDTSQPIIVTVGDVNNDNYLDLIFTTNGTISVGVILGYGDGTFANITIYSTGFDSFPYEVTVADINGDKQLDIVVANYGTNNVGIHLGYGNGTFASQIIYSTGLGSHPYSVAISDLNKDNKLDIIVANSGTGNVAIFLGYGNGTFADKTTLSTNVYGPVQIVVGDINYDHRKDIAIVSSWNNNIYILLGYDNGTFEEKLAYSTNIDSGPRSIAVSDLNNDNRTDVIVANYGTNNVGIFFGYDPAPFRNQTTYSTGNNSLPCPITLGDLNNDDILDIIATNIGTENIGVFLGYGDGTFAVQSIYSTGNGSEPSVTVIGDFNNDNRSDVVVANSGADNIGIFLGYGNGSFQKQIIFSTGRNSRPRSVAVGDFNGDNQLDVVVVNYDANNIGLFLGYGNGSFANQRTFSTGEATNPSSIVIADFNNDNRLDIGVANSGKNTVGIFLGYGTGNFTPQTRYFTDFYHPSVIVVGDVNNDNQFDIIIAIYNDEVESAGLFLGFGDGTFETRMRYPAKENSSPYWVAVGDLNNDNYQDIVLANLQTDNIGILLSHGDGTFASQKTYSTGQNSYPKSIILGDLNNDNRLDIVVGNYAGFNVGVFLGYSYGALESPISYSTGSGSKPQSVTLGDFNHDNHLDIAVANYGTNTVGVYLQFNNLTFANQILYQTGSNSLPKSIILADFNKDNELDIAVANFGNDNICLFFGYSNGTFGIEMTYSTGSGSQPCAIALGDFNNDNWQDIAISNYGTNNVGIYLGYKYPNHGNQMIYSTESNSYPYSITIGDLNNDNHLDIVVVNINTENVGVFLGYGNGVFGTQIIYFIGAGSQPSATTIADFNNDNQVDVIVVYYGFKSIGVFLGYGNGTFASPIIYSIGNQSEPRGISTGDFNNDTRLDIVIVADSDTDHVIVLLGNGDGTFVNQTNYSTGSSSRELSVSVNDFNNDNQLDIVIANYNNDNIGIFLGYGNGTFAAQRTFSTGQDSFPTSIAVGDLNNDNNLDIVVANSETKNIGIFLGYGNGSFTDQKVYFISLSDNYEPNAVAIGDFNNDNRLDIVVTLPDQDNVALFLAYGNDTFKIVRSYSTGYQSYPMVIAVADFNHDNVLDIVVANSGTGNIGIFLGYCCEVFLQQTTFPTGFDSGPNSVTVGDFNVDGILDIVVANKLTENIGVLLGYGNGTFDIQMTYSTGLGSRPYSVAIGDFNNDTYPDIVVTNYGTETIGIFLGYGNGTFGDYTTYSIGFGSRPYAITVLDFNQDDQLDIAVTNDGTNNVAVIFGYGNGSFGALTIYGTGYNSRPCAIAVGDYNDDRQTDIVVTECGSNNIGIISKFC